MLIPSNDVNNPVIDVQPGDKLRIWNDDFNEDYTLLLIKDSQINSGGPDPILIVDYTSKASGYTYSNSSFYLLPYYKVAKLSC